MKNCVMQNNGRAAGWLLVGALSLAAAMPAGAVVGITLTNNNSIAEIDPYSQAGMNRWVVDGGTSALKQQWFWYRVGSTAAEQSINAIGAPAITSISASSAKLVYTSPGLFDIQVTYTLTGGSLGSGASDIDEQIRINNLSASALDFHFFQYSDFNLGASDSVGLSQNLLGKFNRSVQTYGGTALQETVIAPGANHGEVAATPFTLNRLNDGVATTLNDSLNAVGDVSWAFQWDFQIAAGGSAQIGKDKRLAVVPEPTTTALAGLGLAVLLAAARRRLS
ncbi:MAG: PEP-CTERM sorting domain-containing protein [Verrucomicrobiota bacterium]